MSQSDEDPALERTREFIAAINLKDPERLRGLLAEDLRYESQAVLEPLLGRDAVIAFLSRKFETVRESNAAVAVELGRVGGNPCGIIHHEGERGALYLLTFDPKGQISAIDICTVAPHPSEAIATGEFPGLEDPSTSEPGPVPGEAILPRDTLVTVVGFAMFEGDGMYREVERALRMLSGEFPNTETRIYLHTDYPRFGTPEWEAWGEMARYYKKVMYPHVAVEAGGRVLMCLHPRYPRDKLIELRDHFTPPPHVLDAVARFGHERFADGTPVCIDHFEGDYAFLSNYSPSTLEFEGLTYPSVENAFQAAKTTDPQLRLDFTKGSADRAKRRGRRLELRPDWNEVRLDVMRQLLEAKFAREPLRGKLLATGEAVLVEGNWWGDQFWGVSKDEGQNHLGRLLMEVRDALAG